MSNLCGISENNFSGRHEKDGFRTRIVGQRKKTRKMRGRRATDTGSSQRMMRLELFGQLWHTATCDCQIAWVGRYVQLYLVFRSHARIRYATFARASCARSICPNMIKQNMNARVPFASFCIHLLIAYSGRLMRSSHGRTGNLYCRVCGWMGIKNDISVDFQ